MNDQYWTIILDTTVRISLLEDEYVDFEYDRLVYHIIECAWVNHIQTHTNNTQTCANMYGYHKKQTQTQV